MTEEANRFRGILGTYGYKQICGMCEELGRELEHWDNAETSSKQSKVFFFCERDEGLFLLVYADSEQVRMVDYVEAVELVQAV